LPCHINDFGVKGGVIIANSLIAKLIVLTVSSCLRPFISKDRGKIIEPYRLGKIIKSMLKISAADRRRALRSQGQLVTPPVGKGVHLLGDNVSILADTAGKKLGVLKDGGVKALVAIKLGGFSDLLFYIAPVGLLFR
jgi:hypothetical protein